MKSVVTGGVGFIGSNVVNFLLNDGHEVIALDNLSRVGTEHNLEWLQNHKNADNFSFYKHDVVHDDISPHLEGADSVFHFAAQVAATTSIENPKEDFEINALATFKLLEAIRLSKSQPILLFSSTNKVYGAIDEPITEGQKRYDYTNKPKGIDETQQLDFYSPYGCSKGSADQYVIDYARIYGLKTVVFRQSTIYGPRQFGIEDQGWIAWFMITRMLEKKLTLYGNGKQVRDILHVQDLYNAYIAAIQNIEAAKGQVFNLGGGAENSISLLQAIEWIEENSDKPFNYDIDIERQGDQKVYISDISKITNTLNWSPQITLEKGLEDLHLWLQSQNNIIREIFKV
ncbi:MAG: GDP-mannose 4,6-dehydratase [Alphaproteobacteria bacterium]